jgi:lipase chaperone LimK
MSQRSFLAPAAAVALAGAAAWIGVGASVPALRARAVSQEKHETLAVQKERLELEILRLRAEKKALQSDYQFNRRVERWLFRGAPEPGD